MSQEPDAEESLKRLKREDVELISGDATSRLVLEKCRVEDAEAVILTITTENISREVATVLHANFKPRRVISVAVTEDTSELLLSMGFEVDNIFASTATDIRNRIERKTKAAHAIGIGKDEILEVEVHSRSRLANKPLGFLKPINWRMGIIYREGNIIIPQRDTILKPRDRVVILGEPQVLRTVAEIMTYNYQKFPLEYGTSLIVYLSGREDTRYIEEVNYIYNTFPFNKAWVIMPQGGDSQRTGKLLEALDIKEPVVKRTSLSSLGSLRDAVSDCGGTQGLVMFSSEFMDTFYSTFFGARKRAFVKSSLEITRCPVLISRGSFPYESMIVPCVGEVEVEHVLETALQISDEIESKVTTMQVTPSKYISGTTEAEQFNDAKAAISSMAMVYKNKIDSRVLEGNPIKAVLAEIDGHDLLLTGMSGGDDESMLEYLFSPDVSWNIVRKSPLSTIVLPLWEEVI